MTNKSIIASKNALKNGVTVKQAMLNAGYSPATANNPSNLKRTKAYKELVLPKLKEHGVTIDQYIKNIGTAMTATKVVTSHTEPDYEVADHTVRLNANKQAEKLLKIDTLVQDKDDIEPEDLEALAKASDEIEMQSIVFRRK